MIDKIARSAADALHGIADGSTVLIGGFGEAGNPTELVHALIDQGARDLVVVNNNAGNGEIGLARLLQAGRVRKLICSFPRSSHGHVFDDLYRAGKIELELVPQGTLAERIRAGGAGIPAFYTPTAAGTDLAVGKETRTFAGREHVLETAIRGDVALIKAEAADRWGNLVYRKAARNFGAVMATAADTTIAQVRRVVPLGELDPEAIVTPSIFVAHVVAVPNPVSERDSLLALDKGLAA
ncbi:3-oxoacid CoA-transferase subunit A [Sphingomonas sp. RP10(2022)]|uniref:3-oxoacid CoA-transferase subunit A n=1 Tax=Sphingomonas liriopis TaxID=2949094 RepID=A0A9X2HRR6_9SPHN|nr:3-oxoacid CoA-transferase subunit A [Sphingomonas liriopis]MCP3734249.1 3-oxoacid CoA-transferase subunit A [Sphingomonas liriopis]